MPERGGPFVGHLGQTLRVEVLGHLAHDPNQLALPGSELGRALLDEVQQVFLRLEDGRRGGRRFLAARRRRIQGGEVRLVMLLRKAQPPTQPLAFPPRRQAARPPLPAPTARPHPPPTLPHPPPPP